MLSISDAQIAAWLASVWLPFARIGGAMLSAPLFSANYVPVRVRVMFALFLTLIVTPLLPPVTAVQPLSLQGFMLIGSELLIGLALGLIVQLVFDALILSGQLIANGMGLGFAMMVDPQRGVQVPVISQYLLIITMLLFVAMNGHLLFVEMLLGSFSLWPAGKGIQSEHFSIVVQQGSLLFSAALRIAIPAIVALLLVQIAVGVISRAAPTMNLFAVGFPLAILVGYLVLEQLIPNLLPMMSALLEAAFLAAGDFLGV